MANLWFKFYGSEYLSDPKFLGMDSHNRSCWLTLLCYCSLSEEPGIVKYLTEHLLMMQAGIPLAGEDWARTEGVLTRFEEKGMVKVHQDRIEVLNWNKKQESYLTEAERSKRYRTKQRDVDVTNVTLEENRVEKNREEKKPHSSLSFLTEIPESDLKDLREKYEASAAQIKRKAEELKNYCDAKGKTYKNYRAFLENALARDFGRRLQAAQVENVEKRPLTADEQAARDRVSAQLRELGIAKRVKTDV